MATHELSLSDLWLDANQGTTKNERAFGYIGTDEETTDEDGDDCEYCGWFFTWPTVKAKCFADEIDAVINSLETDETQRHCPEIPYALVEERLRTYLEKKAIHRDSE